MVFLCLTVPLPPVLGAMALLGDRPTDPTEVALGAAGFFQEIRNKNTRQSSLENNSKIIIQINYTYHGQTIFIDNPRGY